MVAVALALSAPTVHGTPAVVALRWPQAAVDGVLRKLFPENLTRGCRVPNLEDLINSSPFTDYHKFLERRGLDADLQAGPTGMAEFRKGWRRAAEGEQKGTLFTAGGPEQVVSLGLTADAHFEAALQAATSEAFPLDGQAMAEGKSIRWKWNLVRLKLEPGGASS